MTNCDDCGTKLEDGYCPKCDYQFEKCPCCGAYVDADGYGIEDCCQMCKLD